MSEKRLKELLDDLDFYILLDSMSPSSYYERGVIKYKLGNVEDALKDIDEAISLDSKFAEAYYWRSKVKKQLGDTSGAEEDRREAIRLEPNVANEIKRSLFFVATKLDIEP